MKDDAWVLGGMVTVLAILSARKAYDSFARLPYTLREMGGGWAGTAFDWYAWWEGID